MYLPFDLYNVSGNEVCMCIYFKSTDSLLMDPAYRLMKKFGKQNYRFIGQEADPRCSYYILSYEVKSDWRHMAVKTTFKDQDDGLIIINSVYPKS